MNRENFQKLANFLKTVDRRRFDMVNYAVNPKTAAECSIEDTLFTCGTVCCAIGHGPQAGILPPPNVDGWWDYFVVCFLGKNHSGYDPIDMCIYRWCVSSSWKFFDNTPLGASRRIEYMLSRGIPPSFISPDYEWVPIYTDFFEKDYE